MFHHPYLRARVPWACSIHLFLDPPSTKLSARDSSLSEEKIEKICITLRYCFAPRCTNSALFRTILTMLCAMHCFDSVRIPFRSVFKFVQWTLIVFDNTLRSVIRSKTNLNRANLVEILHYNKNRRKKRERKGNSNNISYLDSFFSRIYRRVI